MNVDGAVFPVKVVAPYFLQNFIPAQHVSVETKAYKLEFLKGQRHLNPSAVTVREGIFTVSPRLYNYTFTVGGHGLAPS